jgi:hypothetical protein
VSANRIWATTLAWGQNSEDGRDRTNALLAETSLLLNDRDNWYGRFELAGKSGHDLDLPTHDVFTVAKLAGGYTRYAAPWRSLQAGIGGGISAGIVPARLEPVYGSRVNTGVAVYLTVRPARSGSR